MSQQPLEGRTIIVTRAAEDGAELAERLRALGARIIGVPAIRCRLADDLREWEEALARRREITHVVFTSRRAADFFLELAVRSGAPAEAWRASRIAAVGPKTAARLRESGLEPDVEPARATGLELARELVERHGVGPGSVVLLPRSALGSPEATAVLETCGATVLDVPIYVTEAEDPAKAAPLIDLIDRGETVDAVVFASPSALQGFLEMTGALGRRLLEAPSTRLVAIGPTTRRAIEDAGLRVASQAARPDVDSLVAAVEAALAG